MTDQKPPSVELSEETQQALADAIEAASHVEGAHPELMLIGDRPVRIAPKGKLHLDTSPDPAVSMLLVLDPKAGMWKSILLPPGERWVLQRESAAKSGLWQPGLPQ